MKSYQISLKLVVFVFCALLSNFSFAACNQTLPLGSNVASAISSAAPGSTICLASGNFGTVSLSNIVKTGDVTIQSSSGRTATVNIQINQSSHLRFQNLTISGLGIDSNLKGGTTNITMSSNTFTGQTVINVGNNSNANILLDGNTFDGISVCSNCYEGRVQVIGGGLSGVTISNNHFGNAGESDGIQLGAYGVVIGPGNVFDGIIQDSYGRHIDAIQGDGQKYTVITGNYFKNGNSYIMMPDGGNTEQITNNVFEGAGGYWAIQLGSHIGDSFLHNTVKNVGVSIDAKVGNPASQNAVVKNNIMIGTSVFKTFNSNNVEACTNCTFDRNLFTSSANARGTNSLVGNPTFVGGASPTTWAGWKLAAGSLGYQAATDGKDVGTNYYGASVGSLAAPTNLRVGP